MARSEEERSTLGRGLYTTAEAARLVGMNRDRVRRWVVGRDFRSQHDGGLRHSLPVFVREPDIVNGQAALTFLDLVEVLFVRAFIKHGVSLPTIRLAAKAAAEEFHSSHPFCVRRFKTDGRTVIAELEDASGERHMLDLARKQAVFEKVFDPLLRQVEYLPSGLAERWWPLGKNGLVVIDPDRSLGEPIVANSCVPTRMLARAAEENGLAKVTSWYRVSPEEVRAAVAFEQKLAARTLAA